MNQLDSLSLYRSEDRETLGELKTEETQSDRDVRHNVVPYVKRTGK